MANSTQYISLSILRTKKERLDSELSAHKKSFPQARGESILSALMKTES